MFLAKISKQFKKKNTPAYICFNLSQLQFIASSLKEMTWLYVSVHPNTMINFQKIQTHFICLLCQFFFSRVHL